LSKLSHPSTSASTQEVETEELKEPEYVDATKLNDALQCLRLYYWRHERSLVPTTPRLPLIFGIAIHAGIAAFYRGGGLIDMVQAFDEEWGPRAMGAEDSKRNPANALRILTAYADQHRNEQFKVLGVEMPGLMPITPIFIWTMIIDLLVQLPNQTLLPIDHKTTSSLGEDWWAQMDPNHQFTGYMAGVQEVSGQKVNTLAVNAILVSKSSPAFERRYTNRHPRELERWKLEIRTFWENTIVSCRKQSNWPRNPDRCQRWWGGCPYHYLCTTVDVDFLAEDPTEELYRKEVWDPLEHIKQLEEFGRP
jgi:hypothetical protein